MNLLVQQREFHGFPRKSYVFAGVVNHEDIWNVVAPMGRAGVTAITEL